MPKRLKSGQRADFRRKYPKHPLAAAAVFVRDNDKLLLVRRAGAPGRGLWSIPGGLIELGEKAVEAAKREVKEETGLDIEIEQLAHVSNNIIKDRRGRIVYHYVIIDYLGHVTGGVLRPTTDINDARWVELKNLNQYPLTKTLRNTLTRLKYVT